MCRGEVTQRGRKAGPPERSGSRYHRASALQLRKAAREGTVKGPGEGTVKAGGPAVLLLLASKDRPAPADTQERSQNALDVSGKGIKKPTWGRHSVNSRCECL